MLGPNPETLSTLASPPMGRFEFFTRFFLVLGGLRREEFQVQYGEAERFGYGTNEPKAFTSLLFSMRHDSIVEFLFDDSNTRGATHYSAFAPIAAHFIRSTITFTTTVSQANRNVFALRVGTTIRRRSAKVGAGGSVKM